MLDIVDLVVTEAWDEYIRAPRDAVLSPANQVEMQRRIPFLFLSTTISILQTYHKKWKVFSERNIFSAAVNDARMRNSLLVDLSEALNLPDIRRTILLQLRQANNAAQHAPVDTRESQRADKGVAVAQTTNASNDKRVQKEIRGFLKEFPTLVPRVIPSSLLPTAATDVFSPVKSKPVPSRRSASPSKESPAPTLNTSPTATQAKIRRATSLTKIRPAEETLYVLCC